jgi:hypothetical protein
MSQETNGGRFRKKPIEVLAVRSDGEWATIIGWLDSLADGRFTIPFGRVPPITRNPDGSLNVVTREGAMRCEVGDWLILEPFAEGDRYFYPCKPHLFEATYEAVTPNE